MPNFTFLHAADIHLDSPLLGLDANAPTERIRLASRLALAALVDLALAREVAFVLLAGDLYDGDAKDWRTGQFLVQQLTRLTRAGIEVIAISGNHDAESVLSRKLPVPGMLRADQAETRLLTRAPVAVHGQSFATRAVTENLAASYPAPVDGLFNIGLLHTACGVGGHDNYAPCTVGDLERRDYDYWALGHVHARQTLCRDPWVVFPGNLQGRHVKEEHAKGALIVTVRDGRVAGEPEFVPLDVVRWRRLVVDVSGAADEAALLARVTTLVGAAALEAEDRLLAVRVTLTGASALHANLMRAPEALREKVRAAAQMEADTETLWIEDVRVATGPAVDVAAMRDQPGPAGALIRALDAPMEPAGLQGLADDLLRRGGEGAVEADHPARAIRDGVIPDSILEQARALLLAELARG